MYIERTMRVAGSYFDENKAINLWHRKNILIHCETGAAAVEQKIGRAGKKCIVCQSWDRST